MENGSWSEEDIDCVSAQFEGLRRGQARHEAKTILQIIDGELRQGSAFSIFRVSQNPSNRTSNIAGRRVDGGQAGVLDLGTLQWTPTSRVQVATGTFGMGHQATSSNQNGMNLVKKLTSLRALLNNFSLRDTSRSKFLHYRPPPSH